MVQSAHETPRITSPQVGNIFLSDYWLKAWIKTLEVEAPDIRRTIISRNGCHLVPKINSFFGVLKRHEIHLNEYPASPLDFTMEYNGLPDNSQRQWENLLGDLLIRDTKWDAIKLTRLSTHNFVAFSDACNSLCLPYEIMDVIEAPYIDLTKGDNFSDLESQCLSNNKRWQIRRASQYFINKYGPITFRHSSPSSDMTSWNKMAELHSAYWKHKGITGSFNNHIWTNFQTEMWAQEDARFKPALFSVYAGDQLLGVVYSLILDDVVNQIQSGFSYSEDTNIAKPGYLTHWLAARAYFDQGRLAYSFLGGPKQFKLSLCNKVDRLYSISVSNPKSLRFENALRSLKNIKARLTIILPKMN